MKKIAKTLKILFVALLSIILLVNIYIMIQTKVSKDKVPSIFGYKPFIVLSGSMETKISVGDLVFVKQIAVDELKVNDIIAFRDSDNLVTTHRIIKKTSSNNQKCFKTKGDNNNTEDDGEVCEKQIEGKYQGKIAKVGNLILFIQEPLGFTIMMLIILIIGILIYFSSNKKMDSKELKEFEEFKKAKAKEKQQDK